MASDSGVRSTVASDILFHLTTTALTDKRAHINLEPFRLFGHCTIPEYYM